MGGGWVDCGDMFQQSVIMEQGPVSLRGLTTGIEISMLLSDKNKVK